MKRKVWMAAMCAALLFCLPLQALAAIVFDGNVLPREWQDYPPAKELHWDPGWCGITYAAIRFAVQPAQSRVMFGFTAVAPGIEADSPIGAAFLVSGREIARWQQGLDASFDSENYDLLGLACIQEDSSNSGFTFEIALGYKTQAALSALEGLSVRLFGPQGVLSQEVPCPVAAAEPVTTTKAPTTERTTTTKAPTTEKPTTTKAPTTEKPTTTKAPTTEKPTTTKAPATEKPTTTKAETTAKPTTAPPVYTTAPPAYIPAPQTATVRIPVAPQATAAAPASTQKAQATQPGTSRTEVFYYTVVYTDAPGAPGQIVTERETLWTYEPPPAEASQPQSVPTLALPATQPSRAASPNASLLLGAGGVLALLAAVLVVLWARAQKKPAETSPTEPLEPPSEPPGCQP
ncbi:MAG: hypothetical protein LBB75_04465 [Oscillospiraceae bacterium]|jgi:hypothetical protein|nr:hypothetical protein [Oscillospiraceae bacterium]